MHIVLFCATRRGYRFLERLTELADDGDISVVCPREETWEPGYFDDIRELAASTGAEFIEAKRIDEARWNKLLGNGGVDLIFAVSWRYLIPARVYQTASRGAFVFHDSLLPGYRGFSPTVWAIINGEDHTGVTLVEMVDEIDAGDIVDQETVPIGPTEYISEIVERVTETYLLVLEKNFDSLVQGQAPRSKQDHGRATYTCKLLPGDCRIDWRKPTCEIYNLVRAYSRPYPGAYTQLAGNLLRIWDASPYGKGVNYIGRVPGRVAEILPGKGVAVLTGDGALLLREVQQENGLAVNAEELLTNLSITLD